jgi:hypothetical protein
MPRHKQTDRERKQLTSDPDALIYQVWRLLGHGSDFTEVVIYFGSQNHTAKGDEFHECMEAFPKSAKAPQLANAHHMLDN